jgi:hypothetical protein
VHLMRELLDLLRSHTGQSNAYPRTPLWDGNAVRRKELTDGKRN